MMPESIAAWHRDLPCAVAGSVDAAATGAVDLTRALSAAGMPVHVEFSPRSSGVGQLRLIVRAARPSPVNVHLRAPAAIDDALRDVLSVSPQRVILPWRAFTAHRATVIRAADARAWVAVWDEWDGQRLPVPWGVDADGILVLLSEPGRPERCRIRHVKVISTIAAVYPAIPLGAAGGITEAVARLCLSAGAQQLVLGTALRSDGAEVSDRHRPPAGPAYNPPKDRS
jgi:pentose-5-phosphate-3-epimerase